MSEPSRKDYDCDVPGKVKLQPGVLYYLPVPGGCLEVCAELDEAYPGVDVEFISNSEEPKDVRSSPRVLVEKAYDEEKEEFGKLRCLVWNDRAQEDYNEEIELE